MATVNCPLGINCLSGAKKHRVGSAALAACQSAGTLTPSSRSELSDFISEEFLTYDAYTLEEQNTIETAFESGDCGHLAIALHQETGLPIYLMGHEDNPGWVHAFVYDKNTDTYIDVMGVSSSDEMYERYVGYEDEGEDEFEIVEYRPGEHDLTSDRYHPDVPISDGVELTRQRVSEQGFDHIVW